MPNDRLWPDAEKLNWSRSGPLVGLVLPCGSDDRDLRLCLKAICRKNHRRLPFRSGPADLVNRCQIFVGQVPVDCSHVLADLLGLHRARDDTRDRFPASEPREREFQKRVAALFRIGAEPFHDLPVACREVAVGVALCLGDARAIGHRLAFLVLSGKESPGEREERQ